MSWRFFQGTNPFTESASSDLVEDGEEIGQEEEDLWYLRRLDGGLFTLQTVDYILAWIIMEDDGVRHLQRPCMHYSDCPTPDPRTRSTDAQ